MKVKQFHEESLGIIVGIISASFSTNKLARFCKLVLYRWRRRSRGLLMRRAEASVSCIITSSQCEHLYLFIVLSLCIYNFTLSIIDLCYDMLWYQICQFHPVYLKFRFFYSSTCRKICNALAQSLAQQLTCSEAAFADEPKDRLSNSGDCVGVAKKKRIEIVFAKPSISIPWLRTKWGILKK
jgi:hypothetical protein